MENKQFEVKVSEKDLASFMIYHNYHSMQGIIGLIISIAAVVLLIVQFRALNAPKIFLLVVLALLFTVVTPITLTRKAKAQQKRNQTLSNMIVYTLKADGFSLTQGEEHVELEWRNVYKIVDTGRCLVMYISTVRAFIWPKDQLGTEIDSIKEFLKKYVEPRKIKFK